MHVPPPQGDHRYRTEPLALTSPRNGDASGIACGQYPRIWNNVEQYSARGTYHLIYYAIILALYHKYFHTKAKLPTQHAVHRLACPWEGDGKGRKIEEICTDPGWCEAVAEFVQENLPGNWGGGPKLLPLHSLRFIVGITLNYV